MKQHRLTFCFFFSFLFTWYFWIGDALLVSFTPFQEGDFLPSLLFTVGGFGPGVAAILCLGKVRNWKNIRCFFFQHEKKSIWILLLLLGLEILTFGLSSLQLNSQISLPSVPLLLLQAIILYGGNEEPGWRGVIQPLLQEKLPNWLAALLLGCIWSVWHLPLWFIPGNSHQGTSFLVFAFLAVFTTFWLAALRNQGGSVFFCMILHGATNILLSLFVIQFNWILVAGLVVLTVLSVWLLRKQPPSSKAKT